ncbi:GNAT family N-acetyltransferase [Wukongibacter baidiensis]|uniref:GNAT family N-acetyltransferase n=1 Tax=Wukongibacter baidiensis TaxID=1723361 RepID=UPI003D7F38B8
MFIREAVLEDMESIKILLDELNHSSAELLPSFFKIAETTNEEIKKLINNESCELIIAEEYRKIVGLIEIHLNETKNIPVLIKKRYIYIQNLIVQESFQRKGVGKALIDAAKKWGSERGIKYYRLSVIPSNNSAISFYINEGFEPIMYNMEMEIKD